MIDIAPHDLETVKQLLAAYFPDAEARVFGSRYRWTAKDYSDLDIALVGAEKLDWYKVSQLREALAESDLPFRVDVLDWQAISPEFQHVIAAGYAVIGKGNVPHRRGLGMSSSEWKTWRIGDIGRIITGKTPPTQNPNNFGDKYPFITPRDMLAQKFIRYTERYLSEDGKNIVKNNLLPSKSICVSCIGSDMGKVVLTTRESFTNQQLNSIICHNSFDPDFIYYAIVSISGELKNAGHHSTAVPILNKTDFSNFQIDVPNLPTQRRIAGILSALDEKIELNRQMNVTLEAMAQAIFEEWFVRYNYPGASGDLVESALGLIPAGWRVAVFEDELEATRGLSYRGSGLEEGGAVPMHNLNSVYEGGGYKFEGIKYYSGEYKEKHLVKPGDLIIANTEQGHKYLLIGYPAIVPSLFGDKGIYSHHIYRVRPKPHSPLTADFLYFLLLQPEIRDQVTGFANGTTVNMLKIEGLQMPKFAIPPKELIDRFTQTASTTRLQQEEMIKESATLAQIRDTLLPKLMRGEIAV